MFDRVPRPLLWGGLAVLSVIVAWLTGNYQGHSLARTQLAEWQSQTDAELLRRQSVISQQQMEIEKTNLARNIADTRAASLQSELRDSLKHSADDAAELALYRRIEEGSGPRGVWIDQVSLVDGETDLLAITLVQSRGRKRAVGRISVALTGGDGGPDRYWVVTDSGTGVVTEKRDGRPQPASGAKSRAANDDVVTIESFDLRFFQTVLVKVKNITTINPEYIEVSVLPETKSLKSSMQRFRWSEISP